MDYWGAILFGVFIYAVLCLIIAVIRSLLSQRSTKKQKFKKHFGLGSLKHLTHSIGFGDY